MKKVLRDIKKNPQYQELLLSAKNKMKGSGQKGDGLGDDIWGFIKKAVNAGIKTVKEIGGGVKDILANVGLTPGEALSIIADLSGNTRFKKYQIYMEAAAAALKSMENRNRKIKEEEEEANKKPKKKGKGRKAVLSVSEMAELRMAEKEALADATRDSSGKRVILSASEVKAVKAKARKDFLKERGIKGEGIPDIIAEPNSNNEGKIGMGRRKYKQVSVMPPSNPNDSTSNGSERGAYSGWAPILQAPNANSYAIVGF